MMFREFERLTAVPSLQYRVTLGFKELAQDGPNRRLILCQEHPLLMSQQLPPAL